MVSLDSYEKMRFVGKDSESLTLTSLVGLCIAVGSGLVEKADRHLHKQN